MLPFHLPHDVRSDAGFVFSLKATRTCCGLYFATVGINAPEIQIFSQLPRFSKVCHQFQTIGASLDAAGQLVFTDPAALP